MNNKHTILVAEDEEYNFKLMKYILQRQGMEVIWARNGEEAVDIIRNNSAVELVMMDLKMPVMNGIDATLEIKKINREIPVIAVTAYAMAEDRERCIKLGFDEYITKPVNMEHLLKISNKFLGIE